MANEKNYNGWHNYETWDVKLWLDNDAGSQELQREWAKQAREEKRDFLKIHPNWPVREPTGILADIVKDFIEECAPELGASMFSDLLNAAIGEVDWYEIAEAILEDNPAEAEEIEA